MGIFWKTHSEVVITERQRAILNVYLNDYEGKLTAKNWSKLAEVSLDTANRDVKDLVAKGVLAPVKGRVRDVSYTLNYVSSDSRMRNFTNSSLINRDGKDYIVTVYRGQKTVDSSNEV